MLIGFGFGWIFYILVSSFSVGLRRVSEYSDIHGSDKKIEYEYSSLPKSLDRDLFFLFFFFSKKQLKQEVFHKMVNWNFPYDNH